MIKKYLTNKTNPMILVFNNSTLNSEEINDLVRKIQQENNMLQEKITFNECFQELKKEWYMGLENNSIFQYEYIYRKFHPLYHKNISDLNLKNLQDIINPYLKNTGIKQKMKIILHKIYNYAEKYDYIDKNYSKFIEIGKIKKPKKRNIYTEKEIKKLWSIKHEDCVKIVLIMIYTGMRIGEVRTLKKENIFIKKKYCIGGSKTNAGRDRIIPLCDKIIPIINYFLLKSKGETLINSKYEANQFNIWLRRKMKKLGFEHKSHDARHTFATKMRMLNVPNDIIKKIMGHKCNSLLLDTYTHIEKKILIRYVNKL